MLQAGSHPDHLPPDPAQPPHYLAVEAGVALGTGTLVGAIAILAGATMQAGTRVTLVDVVLAVAAREARWTEAGKGVDSIHASATIEAGAGGGRAAEEGVTRGHGTLAALAPPPGSEHVQSGLMARTGQKQPG